MLLAATGMRATEALSIRIKDIDLKSNPAKVFVRGNIPKQDYWLWIAYEPALNRCLMMNLSRERTIFVCYRFFRQLRNRYGRKPIFTYGARWYNYACKWLRLNHQIYDTGDSSRS
jgi:transposase-like protein